MKRFIVAHSVLTSILNDNLSFSIAMHNAFKDEKNKVINRHDVSSLVGCSLRHHLIFKKRIDDQFGELVNDQFAYISLALANSLFVKLLDEDKVNKELERLSSIKDIDAFVKTITPENIIPEDIKKDSIEYLSYRYNTPLWLAKMWKKHYKDDVYYRLLRSNSKAPSKFYMAKDQYDFSNGFVPTKVEGIYKKVDKSIKDNNLLLANPAYKYAIDQLDIDPIRGLLIYSEVTSPILNHLYPHLNKFAKADYLAGSPSAFFETKKVVKELGLDGINAYECPSSAILTVVSKPVHTLIILPENSHFSLLRERPDYFLHIHQEDLDNLLAHQAEVLDNAAPYVEEGGQLLYLIDTISKKEAYSNIFNFLQKHKDFVITDQKQFLPCNSLESALYFAILQKKGQNDD